MKSFCVCISVICLTASCGESKQHLKHELTGTYLFTGGTEFSNGTDTLQITAYDEDAGTYIIIRKTGYTPLLDGKPPEKQFKVERFIGTYDEKKKQLVDAKTGRTLSFSTESENLLFGTATYQKMKQQ